MTDDAARDARRRFQKKCVMIAPLLVCFAAGGAAVIAVVLLVGFGVVVHVMVEDLFISEVMTAVALENHILSMGIANLNVALIAPRRPAVHRLVVRLTVHNVHPLRDPFPRMLVRCRLRLG